MFVIVAVKFISCPFSRGIEELTACKWPAHFVEA
jgi:hypothetical protein